MPANQWVAVYSLEQRLRLAQPFTRDPSRAETRHRARHRRVGRKPRSARDRHSAIRTRPSDRPTPPLAAVAAAQPTGDAAKIGAAVSEARGAEVTARMERMVETADSQQRGQSTLFPLMALMKAQGTPRRPQGAAVLLGGAADSAEPRGSLPIGDQRGESGQRQHLRGGRAGARYRPFAGPVAPDARPLRPQQPGAAAVRRELSGR